MSEDKLKLKKMYEQIKQDKFAEIRKIESEILEIFGKIFEIEYDVPMGSFVELNNGRSICRGIIHPDDSSVAVYMYKILKNGQLDYRKTYVYGSDFKTGKAKIVENTND